MTTLINSVDPDFGDNAYDAYFANLTPCSSTLTVQDYIPVLSENNPVKNSMITLILPNLRDRACFPLSDVVSYVQARDASFNAENITVHHLILFIFFEKLNSVDDLGIPIKYISQLKLINMGKSYRLSSLVDISFPISYLPSFSLFTILSTSPIFQVSAIPSSNVVPFAISEGEIDNRLKKVINHRNQPVEDRGSHGSIKDQLKRVRSSISSGSSRKQSVSSIESAGSSLTRSRSSSIPTRSLTNGSETEVDEISIPNTFVKPLNSRHRSRISIRSNFRRLFH